MKDAGRAKLDTAKGSVKSITTGGQSSRKLKQGLANIKENLGNMQDSVDNFQKKKNAGFNNASNLFSPENLRQRQ